MGWLSVLGLKECLVEFITQPKWYHRIPTSWLKNLSNIRILLATGPASLMQTMKTLLLKGLAGSASGSNSNLKKSTLTAILTLITRPSLTEKHLSAMILHIFSVPGLVHHCGPDLCKKLIFKNGIFGQIIGKNF
jgi:hypothetical protein